MFPLENDIRNEIAILTEEYLAGTIDLGGATRLIEICEKYPEVTDGLLDALVVNEALNDLRKYNHTTKVAEQISFRKKMRVSWLRFLYQGHRLLNRVRPNPTVFRSICFIGIPLLVGVLVFWTWGEINRDSQQLPPVAQKTILLKTQGARWEIGDSKKLQGDLGSDWLRLLEGLALIDFSSGVQVVLDGLTEFRPISENRAVCTRGNLNVLVAKRGTGFRVDLPQISVIDLGTEFRVETSEKESRIYVLDGKVSLVDPGSSSDSPMEKCLLLTGEAARVDANGIITRFVAPTVNFKQSTAFLNENRCRLIAHRGASKLAPECTLPAFQKAIELNADGCSIPVFASKDKQPVVLAESQLKRTSGVTGLVENRDLTALKKLDVGKWKGAEFAGETIPTLEEVLDLFVDTECIPYIELMVEGLETQVIDLLRKKNLLERSVIVSRLSHPLRKIRSIEPRAVTCWRHAQKKTFRRNSAYFTRELRKIGTNRIVVELVSDEFLRELIETQKLDVGCWTVNDQASVGRLLRLGITNIATDNLSRMDDITP